MSDVPLRLVARRLAPPGTPAGDLVDRKGVVAELLDGAFAPRAARLPVEFLGASGSVGKARLEEILAGGGCLVSTGQQPLLFLGPLFVLYKALTAIAVAEALTESGTPALPLFWIASDDHDWDEVGTTWLLDLENRLRRLRLDPPEGREGKAVGPTPLPRAILERMDELRDILPPSEFIAIYFKLFQDAYRPGRSLSEAFIEALVGILEPRPLVWVDAASAGVRRAARPLLERAVREVEEVDRVLERGAGHVREAGYDVQLHHATGSPPVFEDRAEGRIRLRVESEDGVEETVERLRTNPERFGPSAALRPVLESWLLPVGATVLGPSEIAYWSQLPPLFAWADTPLPRVHPRHSWTVVERKIDRVLEKLGVDIASLADGGEALIRRETEAGRPDEVERALREARACSAEAMDGVGEAVDRHLPGIRSAVGATRHQIFELLDGLEKEVDHRVRERQEVLNRQIRKTARHLRPEGRPQERILNPLYYLARYGDAFVDRLEKEARSREEIPSAPERQE